MLTHKTTSLADFCCRYVPVLMGMARIYWDRGNYAQVERIFRQSAEFASEHETWKLNVAHTFFMQVGVKTTGASTLLAHLRNDGAPLRLYSGH